MMEYFDQIMIRGKHMPIVWETLYLLLDTRIAIGQYRVTLCFSIFPYL
jgi:hypothetical protein